MIIMVPFQPRPFCDSMTPSSKYLREANVVPFAAFSTWKRGLAVKNNEHSLLHTAISEPANPSFQWGVISCWYSVLAYIRGIPMQTSWGNLVLHPHVGRKHLCVCEWWGRRRVAQRQSELLQWPAWGLSTGILPSKTQQMIIFWNN